MRSEFRKNALLTNAIEIENAKAGAVRALANYVLMDSGRKDATVSRNMEKFHESSVKEAKQQNDGENSKNEKEP